MIDIGSNHLINFRLRGISYWLWLVCRIWLCSLQHTNTIKELITLDRSVITLTYLMAAFESREVSRGWMSFLLDGIFCTPAMFNLISYNSLLILEFWTGKTATVDRAAGLNSGNTVASDVTQHSACNVVTSSLCSATAASNVQLVHSTEECGLGAIWGIVAKKNIVKAPNAKFRDIPAGASLLWSIRTDRRMDMTKLWIALWNCFSNASRNCVLAVPVFMLWPHSVFMIWRHPHLCFGHTLYLWFGDTLIYVVATLCIYVLDTPCIYDLATPSFMLWPHLYLCFGHTLYLWFGDILIYVVSTFCIYVLATLCIYVLATLCIYVVATPRIYVLATSACMFRSQPHLCCHHALYLCCGHALYLCCGHILYLWFSYDSHIKLPITSLNRINRLLCLISMRSELNFAYIIYRYFSIQSLKIDNWTEPYFPIPLMQKSVKLKKHWRQTQRWSAWKNVFL
jgi:hypothetical protein